MQNIKVIIQELKEFESSVIGQKIVAIGYGNSFIELELESGEVLTIETTNERMSKYQDNPDIKYHLS